MRHLKNGLTITMITACLCTHAGAGAKGSPAPIQVEGGRVTHDGAPYQGIGVNCFNAFLRRLQDPADTSYREGFQTLADHGVPFVRFAACGFWPAEMRLYQENREQYFVLLDDVVDAAEENGLGLIPSLFWFSACVPDLVGEPRNQWGNPGSETRAFMRTYTREMVERYKDRPALWAWEFGNEYNLDVDLPNAAEHRPWTVPDLGTPESRSEADDLRHNMVVDALADFARTVREIDPHRPITTGHSMPRPSAHHQRIELAWNADTPAEMAANLRAVTPDPMDLASVHLYPHQHDGRFGKERMAYTELLRLCGDAAGVAGKALFVGEFGAGDNEERGGPDFARRETLEMFTAIEWRRVPLAAHWVFDFPHQKDDFSVTKDNQRSYVLGALRSANRRLALLRDGTHEARIETGRWPADGMAGRVLDNTANADRSGSGFNPLFAAAYPGENLFRDDAVGLNFEHVFNGAAAGRERSMFTPRKDPCVVAKTDGQRALLHWPSGGSSWGLDCKLTYAFDGPEAIDLAFEVTPSRNEWPLGYLAMMWASYMNHTRDRRIHFYGRDGDREGWVAFGEDDPDRPEGFETGTVRHSSVEPLPYEEDAQALNIVEHPGKTFLLPFFYGLVDGDGVEDTKGDTMAYVMMFDQTETIRFAMWNFITRSDGEPDTRSPAWDWQFVLRDPEPGKTYRYRARVLYIPFESAGAIRARYEEWAGGRSAE